MSKPSPLLQMTGISKRFGATHALKGVELQLSSGDVMALIGENGAGKSTLMKILSGAITADSGEITLDGKPYAPSGPSDARDCGIAMIYQELNLAPDLSVEDNIMLGQEVSSLGFLNRRAQHRKVMEALDLLGHPELKPNLPVNALSVGAQQLVEIARALVMNAKVIVFDEPTSSLTQKNVEHLFEVIRKLQASNIGIVYISHFLEEVKAVCNRYTVLRDGETVGTGEVANISEEEVVSLMVGRDVKDMFPTVPHQSGDVILSVENLSVNPMPQDATFELHRGEILGIAGLVGAGRTELLRAIFGLEEVQSGSVKIAGKETLNTPRARIRAGLGFVSEDRKEEGLAQTRSIEDNLTYSKLSSYATFGWLNLSRRRKSVEEWMQKIHVKARSADQEMNALSGGNQQKVAIARVLHQEADVLLLDEPTRGIDIGTKAEIYRLIGELAANGKAILFVSSYLPELLAVCDRIAVMSRGKIREIRNVKDWTEEDVMHIATRSDEVATRSDEVVVAD